MDVRWRVTSSVLVRAPLIHIHRKRERERAHTASTWMCICVCVYVRIICENALSLSLLFTLFRKSQIKYIQVKWVCLLPKKRKFQFAKRKIISFFFISFRMSFGESLIEFFSPSAEENIICEARVWAAIEKVVNRSASLSSEVKEQKKLSFQLWDWKSLFSRLSVCRTVMLQGNLPFFSRFSHLCFAQDKEE